MEDKVLVQTRYKPDMVLNNMCSWSLYTCHSHAPYCSLREGVLALRSSFWSPKAMMTMEKQDYQFVRIKYISWF